MADARSRERWAHTSALLTLIANVNRDPKKTRAFRPKDFNPYERRTSGMPITKGNIGVLKQVFVKEERA